MVDSYSPQCKSKYWNIGNSLKFQQIMGKIQWKIPDHCCFSLRSAKPQWCWSYQRWRIWSSWSNSNIRDPHLGSPGHPRKATSLSPCRLIPWPWLLCSQSMKCSEIFAMNGAPVPINCGPCIKSHRRKCSHCQALESLTFCAAPRLPLCRWTYQHWGSQGCLCRNRVTSGGRRKWDRGGHSMVDLGTEGTTCLWGEEGGRMPGYYLERGEGQVQLDFLLESGGWLILLMFI